MTSSAPHIVLFGATGFIGGSLLHHLLHSSLPSYSGPSPTLTIVSGSPSKASDIDSWLSSQSSKIQANVQTAPRDSPEQWYLASEKLAGDADLVIQAATSDDLELTKAINRGLAEARKRGRKGTLLHLSGVQLIESEPIGKYVEVTRYDDSNVEQIAGISDQAAHRLIDLEIVNAIARGDFWGSIVCPALVWGEGKGPVAKWSAQAPDMVKKALYNSQAVYCGEGTNEWINVHIDDLCQLLLHLVSLHLSQPVPASPPRAHSTFYFASADQRHDFKTLAKSIGKALKEEGLLPTSEAKSVPVPQWDRNMKGVRVEDDSRTAADEEVENSTPLWPCRTNCDCVSERGRIEFGWVAKRVYDEEAMVEDTKDTVRKWKENGVMERLPKKHK